MAPKALIFVAHGTEELEAVTVYDVLVRGGIQVQSVFVGSSSTAPTPSTPHSDAHIICSRGVKLIPDLRLPELKDGAGLSYDALIVPGGVEGAKTISENVDVQALLAAAYGKGTLIGCICAGALAAKTAGIGKDNAITSHPSVRAELENDYTYKEDRVVVAKNLITSRGPGTALAFALQLVEALAGEEKRKEVEKPMVLSEKL
ncbi:unnamed protein product [Tilletia controversa]|nr:hypothetical protein CF328_g4986 [Tilletia controversa]CAD6927520.1 unnamed protein product [Tilletia controversa]